uniref:DUF433 domain-containing protein n=1 Tax=Schlesneria paludicola TaxID=360056 RepID=A0A7C2JYG4_9PLAN
MSLSNRITVDPAILVGKPVVRGTRLSVEFLIGLLAQGWSEAEILRNYPGLTHEDLLACLAYAQETLQSERVFPTPVATGTP